MASGKSELRVIRVHVVTSCTDRKKAPVPGALRVGSVQEADLDSRVAAWVGRLESAESRVSARDLYGGEHWFELLKVLEAGFRPGTEVQGWVISAGYGLIPVDAQVSPYSASFNRQTDDRVRPTNAAWMESDWWEALAHWTGPCTGSPRSLHSLAEVAGGELILVAASPGYLRAVSKDLVGLLDTKTAVLVFSTSPPVQLRTRSNQFVSYDSRVREAIGGSQIGLNIRTLAHALREATDVSIVSLQAVIADLMKDVPKAHVPTRTVATDAEVRHFIRSALCTNPRARPSPLLSDWRSMNRACEQGRFKALFGEEAALRPDLQTGLV